MPDRASDLLVLADDFWEWRAGAQACSGDDIPRIERPAGWRPEWSAEAVAGRRTRLAGFLARWRGLADESATWPVELQVDYRLIGSALARVGWELDTLQNWRRNPRFYVHQTLGAVFEALLQPPPFDAQRSEAIVRRAESIPASLEAARVNLTGHAVRPFATMTINNLEGVAARLQAVVQHLTPYLNASPETPVDPSAATSSRLDPSTAITARFERAMTSAARALENYREWLLANLESMPTQTALGRAAYVRFLRDVALIPVSPEHIAAAGRQELERAVAFETYEHQRNRDVPPLTMPATQHEQIERQAAGELMLRTFCEQHDLLSFPSWLRRYQYRPIPAYLVPLRDQGVTDDLTSPTRLSQDATCYIPQPSPDLPYFYLAMARDPRTLIAHEGMHYYQLARAWMHPNPIRRHYYDSGANEGIGFYAEEMLLQAGLFDDSPHSREIIYNFMRLRALRVSVDVRLALGDLTIETAARELEQRVPMDAATALEEASFFASDPGQAITYQIGKLQILGFLADARLAQGDGVNFNVGAFHDSVWINGNVPIALQRWEALGTSDEIHLLDTAM